MSKTIYGVSDKTGGCPFYTDFYENKNDALSEMEKQMHYAQIEFGFEELKIIGNRVVNSENKELFSVDTYKLK